MKHLILGTAGHIDHGKTSLVKALTGIDTDRLKEEKARGITIELGFANLTLSGGYNFGIVDVPGHEKFVRAMVAGVAGMDLVMLVIAADEGIMPQTREHLDILRLLGIKSGLVALTKCDLVEKEWLELVTEEVRDFVVDTFLEGAPIVPVSSRTGEGLDRLKEALGTLAETAAEKKREGYYRLPVDRVFTVSGFGTVVTGTLLSGEINVGDEMEILPTGITGRVRGIQAHGSRSDKGLAGQRLAVNLQGVDLDQVHRGQVVVPRDIFRPTRAVDVRLDYLKSAPRELKHRSTVRLHSATYEVPAQVILLDRDALQPGESCFAQLRLREPALLLSGDSYIIRASSPQITVGGGVTLDPFPVRRRRRSDEALQLLDALATEDQQRTIALIISQSLLSGVSYEDIVIRCGLPKKIVDSALGALLTSAEAVQMNREPRIFLAKEAVSTLKQVLVDALTTYMETNPLKEGMGKEELKTRLPKRSDQRFFTPLISSLEKEGKLIGERDLVRLAGSQARASVRVDELGKKICTILKQAGIEPPTVKEMLAQCRCDEKLFRDNLAILVKNGEVVRISSEFYYAAEAVNEIREKLVAYLHDKGEIVPSEFRDMINLSRKFLIPLLEYFDTEKLTIRVGDKRILRKK